MSEEKEIVPVEDSEARELEKQVDDTAKELSKAIAKAEDSETIDPLYDKFKLNDTKKNVFRINKLNSLMDKLTDEASERISQRPGEMSNKEIIDYLNAVQTQIDRSKGVIDDAKDIQLTQVNNTVNVNIEGNASTLSRDSRQRIMDFLSDMIGDADRSDTEKSTADTEDDTDSDTEKIIEVDITKESG